MDENQIADFWNLFKEYIDKKQIELAAESFVDLLADYGVEDDTLINALSSDRYLDNAINYYLDIDVNYEDRDDEDW